MQSHHLPGGSWQQSAKGGHIKDGKLHAELKDRNGHWKHSCIYLTSGLKYSNQDGKLMPEVS